MTYIDDKDKLKEIDTKAEMIWHIADKLTGAYKPHEYGLVILPFTVLWRLDCAFERKRSDVILKYEQVKDYPEKIKIPVLEEVSGLKYYETNPKGLRSVLENPKDVSGALKRFINNFSPNIQEILNEFKIFEQIERLDNSSSIEGGLLFAVLEELTQEKNNLSPEKISDIEMGYLFEEIIRRFSESYNEDAGQHYTPRDAIDLMVDILIRDEDKIIGKETARSILDPACGTGGMLSEAREYMHKMNPKISLQCHGQEYNPETYAICRANTLIKDASFKNISTIVKGDTLSNYQFKNQKFNYIISNPPFGREWKIQEKAVKTEAADIEHGRFTFGLPAIGDSQMLFLATAVSAMESPYEGQCVGGRVTIIHNGSALFTGDAGSGPSEIRKYILEHDYLDAIIALPENIFYNTGIGTYVWVLDNNKKDARKGKVQLIDGRNMYTTRRKSIGNKRVDIDEKAIEIISCAYHEFKDTVYEDGKRSCESKIVDTSEFGYVKVAVIAPELDENGNIKTNKHGSVIYDKSKNDTECIPIGKVILDPKKDLLRDPVIKKTIEDYMGKEVRPYVKYADIDSKKSKVGFEIPFTRYFYKHTPPRPSEEIRAEIAELNAKIAKLMEQI